MSYLRFWFAILLALALLVFPAMAADVIVNESNAVANDQPLKNGKSDTFWGTRLGNGNEWFELAVLADHVDMREWRIVAFDDTVEVSAEEGSDFASTSPSGMGQNPL